MLQQMQESFTPRFTHHALLQTLSSLGRGICLLDSEGRFESWNELFLEFFHIQNLDMKSMAHWSDFSHCTGHDLGIEDLPHHTCNRSSMQIGAQRFDLHLIPLEHGGLSLCYTPFVDLSDEVAHLKIQNQKLKREVLALQDALDDMSKESLTDRLTGAWNRRYFDQNIQVELHRAGRFGQRLSVLIFDIDHFKKINDCHGHPIGDQVLIHLSTIVRATLRETDLLIRWGGEEFMILAPGSDKYSSALIAEKLRQHVALYDFPGIGKVTISLGIAEYIFGENIEQAVERADLALYRAKNGGRNQWVLDQSLIHADPQQNLSVDWQRLKERLPLHKEPQYSFAKAIQNIVQNPASPSELQNQRIAHLYTLLEQCFEEQNQLLQQSPHPKAKWHCDIHQHLLLSAEILHQQYQHGQIELLPLLDFYLSQILDGHMGQIDPTLPLD